PAAQRFDPSDVLRADGLGVLNAPSKAVKWNHFVHFLQGIEERRNVLVVADVHAEGDPPLNQLAYILLNMLTHQVGIDDDRRTVKILMVMHFQLQYLAGPTIDVAMV